MALKKGRVPPSGGHADGRLPGKPADVAPYRPPQFSGARQGAGARRQVPVAILADRGCQAEDVSGQTPPPLRLILVVPQMARKTASVLQLRLR